MSRLSDEEFEDCCPSVSSGWLGRLISEARRAREAEASQRQRAEAAEQVATRWREMYMEEARDNGIGQPVPVPAVVEFDSEETSELRERIAALEKDLETVQEETESFAEKFAENVRKQRDAVIKEQDLVRTAEEALGAQIENLKMQRDEARAELADLERLYDVTNGDLMEANEHRAELRAKAERLTGALGKYGFHLRGCLSVATTTDMVREPPPCTCGLNAALRDDPQVDPFSLPEEFKP